MSKELDLAVREKIEDFRALLKDTPDGSYYIPNTTIVNYSSQDVRLLTWLMMELCREFPEFEWSETENLATPGITISWRRRYVS